MCAKTHWATALFISVGIVLLALCAKDSNAAVIRNALTTVVPGLNQTTTGNSTVQPTTPEVCADENKSCQWWSKYGYCYNGYVNGYMKKVCKKSCGFCGHMSGPCKDRYYYCPSWTRYTLGRACKLRYYQIRCPYTCRACEQ